MPAPAELTCTHTLGARERPGISGLVPPTIEVHCTLGCGFSALGPNLPMAWLNAGAKIAGDRSAIELQQMRALLGQLVLVVERDSLPEDDRLDEGTTRIVINTARIVGGVAMVVPPTGVIQESYQSRCPNGEDRPPSQDDGLVH